MTTGETIIGIDVSQADLDCWTLPTDQAWRVAYTDAGLTDLVAELSAVGLPVVVVNPRSASGGREFARATGQLAKTDRLDAAILAQCGATLRPPVRPRPDRPSGSCRPLVVARGRLPALRRRQLIVLPTQERNRRRQVSSELVAAQMTTNWPCWGEQLAHLDQDVAARLQRHPVWKARARLLRSIPGVGPVLVATLLAEAPELGHASHKETAALAGVAPYPP